MITHGTQSVNPRIFDWCEMLGCIWIVLPGGTVSACLRCEAPYPYLSGEPVVDMDDEEPFT